MTEGRERDAARDAFEALPKKAGGTRRIYERDLGACNTRFCSFSVPDSVSSATGSSPHTMVHKHASIGEAYIVLGLELVREMIHRPVRALSSGAGHPYRRALRSRS